MEHKCKKPDIKTVEKCELNREQVIEDLERSVRLSMEFNCEYPVITYSKLKAALSLIKELNAKVAEWEEECDLRGDMWCELNEENKRLIEENDRLSAYNENLIKENTYLSNHLLDEVEQAKDLAIVDTLSELKIRLTREVGTYLSISIMKVSDMFKLIDQIAEEVIGGSYGKKD
jgi:hypothetical protein